jgi:hypothetical protein
MANFQNVSPVRLCQAALTATAAVLYTAPAGIRTYLKQIDVANTTNGSLDLNIHIVPTRTAVGTANAIVYTVAVAQHTSYQWRGVQIMNAGDTLQAKGSATGLTLTASGGEAV